ncbi:hypothetical protein C0Q70_21101 [Pomacea canaliculata]|uniref:G-protein coupled receptors family 1 profile domain-containing protein n=1 Tax=Pomacea canaliculata TaxID=400727 RepID=A0A2T7NBL4_POMCA|nr:hypothetical protein C0Q70_21101 [Pomacea canaliculata]
MLPIYLASSDHALLENNIEDPLAMDNTTEPPPVTHTSPPPVDMTSHPLFKAGFMFWKISPVSVAMGTYGNIAVFLVFYEQKCARSSMSVSFMTLAVTDLIGIYFNLVPRCASLGFNFDIKGVHDLICKLFFWISYSSSTMSTWLLVVMDEFSIAVYKIWFGLDTITSSFLPFIILLIDNILLIRHVRRSTREARLRLAVGSQQQIKVREQKVMSMTVTLITTSLTFFFMTFPYYVVESLSMLMTDILFSDVGAFQIYGFAWNICTFLWCSHHSVNFYLYCLTGSRFRVRARHVLFPCKSRSAITHSIPATGTSCREQPAKRSDGDFSEEFQACTSGISPKSQTVTGARKPYVWAPASEAGSSDFDSHVVHSILLTHPEN